MASLKTILKAGFPFISAGLAAGGPIGSMAATAIGNALGVNKPNPSEDDIQSAIAKGMTADQILAMKQAEQDFQLNMQKLGYEHVEDLDKIAEQDRESARNREIQVRDKTPRNLAYAVVTLAFTAEMIVLFHGTGHTDPMVVGRILGMLDSAVLLVLGYYYGSSKDTSDQKETIANLSK